MFFSHTKVHFVLYFESWRTEYQSGGQVYYQGGQNFSQADKFCIKADRIVVRRTSYVSRRTEFQSGGLVLSTMQRGVFFAHEGPFCTIF